MTPTCSHFLEGEFGALSATFTKRDLRREDSDFFGGEGTGAVGVGDGVGAGSVRGACRVDRRRPASEPVEVAPAAGSFPGSDSGASSCSTSGAGRASSAGASRWAGARCREAAALLMTRGVESATATAAAVAAGMLRMLIARLWFAVMLRSVSV